MASLGARYRNPSPVTPPCHKPLTPAGHGDFGQKILRKSAAEYSSELFEGKCDIPCAESDWRLERIRIQASCGAVLPEDSREVSSHARLLQPSTPQGTIITVSISLNRRMY